MRASSRVLAVALVFATAAAHAADPLPSWNDGPTKQAILSFVERVTTKDGPDFVPPAERIAVFDNDGTLWSEQPGYFQFLYAMDRVRAMAKDHPEWADKYPYKAVIERDREAIAKLDSRELGELLIATHAGMTTDAFHETASAWLKTARHPRFDRPFTECVYQPMLELLRHLRSRGFKTYIVSGGGVEFIRVFAEDVYGIPPEQVIGSRIKLKYELVDGRPTLVRLPELDFLDDKEGKPVAIEHVIGRRPIACFGNSDGDLQMLQWTTIGRTPSLGVIVHHTDADREWAYDRDSHIGRLDKAWDEANERGWTVIDMKQDWRRVYPPKSR